MNDEEKKMQCILRDFFFGISLYPQMRISWVIVSQLSVIIIFILIGIFAIPISTANNAI